MEKQRHCKSRNDKNGYIILQTKIPNKITVVNENLLHFAKN